MKKFALALTLAAASTAWASVVPVGLQAGVSAATVAGWGFSTCASTPGTASSARVNDIINACHGDYLAMAVRDTRTNTYAIFGAGELDTVTRVTYADYNADNGAATRLNNWSNGLNFYRTQNDGSWGFTTIDRTALNSADILLINGLQDAATYGNWGIGANEDGVAAAGLSFHVWNDGAGMVVGNGWVFNTTGYNETYMYENFYVREFLVADANRIPEPGTLAAVAVGLLAAGVSRKRKAK